MADEELCATCGKSDSKGIPCYLMFRTGTNITSCSGYENNPKKHAKLVKTQGKDPVKGGEK